MAPRWRELAKLGWGSPHRPIDGESNLCLGLAFSAVGFGLGGVLFVLTPYLQIVQGNDALATGVRLLPQMAGFMVGAGAGQRLLSSFGTKVTVAGGLFVTAAGVLLLSQANAATSYAVIAAALSVVGLGMGSAMPIAMDAILGALPQGRTGLDSRSPEPCSRWPCHSGSPSWAASSIVSTAAT